MPYDRDSFLAGLAVGRTLWRPHIISPGARVGAYPCFPMNGEVEVDFTYPSWGETVFTKQRFMPVSSYEVLFPSAGYWMLWRRKDYPHYPLHEDALLFFVAEWEQPGFYLHEEGYQPETGSWVRFSSTNLYPLENADSEVAAYQYRYYVALDNRRWYSPFFEKWAYLDCSLEEKERFMETARLVSIGGQTYIVGEIP